MLQAFKTFSLCYQNLTHIMLVFKKNTSLMKSPVFYIHPLSLRNTCYVFLVIFIFTPCATSLSFNFPDLGTKNLNDMILQGNNSYISDQGIEFIPDNRNPDGLNAGRAVYGTLLHLWDSGSGGMVDFNTNFSFVIDSNGRTKYGDGLTFFLAPNDSVIGSAGGTLGLPIDWINQQAVNPFVAVEFDTFLNVAIDQITSEHVGIDISSLKSAKDKKWLTNITYGKVYEATINYDSLSKNLGVSWTGYQDNVVVRDSITYNVDLREVLPEWVVFGFTAASQVYYENHTIKSWGFQNSDFKIQEGSIPLPRPNSTDPTSMSKGHRLSKKVRLVVGLTALALSVVLVIALSYSIKIWSKWRREKKQEEEPAEQKPQEEEHGLDLSMDDEFEKGVGPKKFTYDELAHATNNFAEEQKLGHGGFGGVYRGFIRGLDADVAVKRVSRSSRQGMKEYASEVKIISCLRHRNLVQLIGWCHEKGELLLVYEFMANGSLDLHLFKGKSLLTWGLRYKIAQGLASALLYLHEEWEQCVLHRDIKSSNVMLDSNFNVKLGDFGLAKLVDHEKGSHTTLLAGTLGYMSPETFLTGKASKGSDVYSFGIVALEIACGQKPINHLAIDGQIKLVDRVWEAYGRGGIVERADPKLCGDFQEKQMERLMIVGLWCAHPDPNFRPCVKQVIQMLNFEAPLPSLPLKMPLLSYASSGNAHHELSQWSSGWT